MGACFFMDDGDKLNSTEVIGVGDVVRKGSVTGLYHPFALTYLLTGYGTDALTQYAMVWPVMAQAAEGSLPRRAAAGTLRIGTLALTSASNAECCAWIPVVKAAAIKIDVATSMVDMRT